jgi:hypothetical protein
LDYIAVNPDLESFASFLQTHNRYICKSVSGTSLEAQNNDADYYHLIWFDGWLIFDIVKCAGELDSSGRTQESDRAADINLAIYGVLHSLISASPPPPAAFLEFNFTAKMKGAGKFIKR